MRLAQMFAQAGAFALQKPEHRDFWVDDGDVLGLGLRSAVCRRL
ncbi:hypothetical protein ACOBQB_03205 [Streptomyces sp. G5(2025)]